MLYSFHPCICRWRFVICCTFPSSLEFRSLLCILGNFGRKFRVYARKSVCVCVRVSPACGVASARSRGQLWKHRLCADRCRATPEMLHMWSNLARMSTGELHGESVRDVRWYSLFLTQLLPDERRIFLSQGSQFCIGFPPRHSSVPLLLLNLSRKFDSYKETWASHRLILFHEKFSALK